MRTECVKISFHPNFIYYKPIISLLLMQSYVILRLLSAYPNFTERIFSNNNNITLIINTLQMDTKYKVPKLSGTHLLSALLHSLPKGSSFFLIASIFFGLTEYFGISGSLNIQTNPSFAPLPKEYVSLSHLTKYAI